MARGIWVTPQEYADIKGLIKSGYRTVDVARITGRGKSTIEFIKRSDDFVDYRSIQRSYRDEVVEDYDETESEVTSKNENGFTEVQSLSWNVHQLNKRLDRIIDLMTRE